MARRIAEVDSKKKWTEEAIAKKLGVSQKTINNWISDIRARQNAKDNDLIYKLNFLGWTQQEIAKIIGLGSKSSISKKLKNSNFTKIQHEIKNFREQGHSMGWIAEHFSLSLQVIWAIFLQGKTDLERISLLKKKLRD